MSNSIVPIKEFRLEISDLTYTGHDLIRPESVLAQPNGTLWTSDGRGGVTRINPDGSQQFIGGLGGNEPNGLAMNDDGSNLQFITSLAFGGHDLRAGYLGSLAMSTLPTFQSPVAGLPLRHWK
jgi:hypothetical protein